MIDCDDSLHQKPFNIYTVHIILSKKILINKRGALKKQLKTTLKFQ